MFKNHDMLADLSSWVVKVARFLSVGAFLAMVYWKSVEDQEELVFGFVGGEKQWFHMLLFAFFSFLTERSSTYRKRGMLMV